MEAWITEPQTAVARIVENIAVFLMYGEVIVVASYGRGKVAALIGVNVKGFAVKPQVCRQIVKIGIFGVSRVTWFTNCASTWFTNSRVHEPGITVDEVSTAEGKNTFINVNLSNFKLSEIEVDKRTALA